MCTATFLLLMAIESCSDRKRRWCSCARCGGGVWLFCLQEGSDWRDTMVATGETRESNDTEKIPSFRQLKIDMFIGVVSA